MNTKQQTESDLKRIENILDAAKLHADVDGLSAMTADVYKKLQKHFSEIRLEAKAEGARENSEKWVDMIKNSRSEPLAEVLMISVEELFSLAESKNLIPPKK